jgi:hypothetical protein
MRPQDKAASRSGIKRAIFSCVGLLVSLGVGSSQRAPVPGGVADFERSRFCKKYECWLETIEPMRLSGEIQVYFYNYKLYGADGCHGAQFGLRLDLQGRRDEPFLLVRWFPIKEVGPREVNCLTELVIEITGQQGFDTAGFVLEFARHQDFRPPNKDAVIMSRCAFAGPYAISCTFTRGRDRHRYPQLSLIVEADSRWPCVSQK